MHCSRQQPQNILWLQNTGQVRFPHSHNYHTWAAQLTAARLGVLCSKRITKSPPPNLRDVSENVSVVGNRSEFQEGREQPVSCGSVGQDLCSGALHVLVHSNTFTTVLWGQFYNYIRGINLNTCCQLLHSLVGWSFPPWGLLSPLGSKGVVLDTP